MDWRKTTLRECAVINDSTYRPSDDWPFINYLDTASLTDNHITGVQHLIPSVDEIPSRARRKVRRGDIVYSMVRPCQRHYGIIRQPPKNLLVSTGFAVLRGREGIAETSFLYRMLTQTGIVDYLQGLAEQSVSAFPAIKATDLGSLPIWLPSIPVQERISNVLDTLDRKIELNRRMGETLDKSVRTLFNTLFTESQAGWPVKSLAEISSTIRGRSYRSTELVETSDTAMVTLKSFRRGGGYSPRGLKPFKGTYKDEQIVRSGDVVVACTDVTQAADVVGRSAVVQRSRRFDKLVASLDVLVVRPIGRTSSAFLYGLTSTRGFVVHAQSYATGTTVLHMDRKAVPSFRFPYPPAAHLATFDRVAEPAIERCARFAEETDCLTELRDILLHRLISGEVRIRDAEKIAEAST